MPNRATFLAVFQDLGPAAEAVDKLHKLGVGDAHMNVISGVPVTEAMLGRPHQRTNVPRLALGGALAGFAVGLFLSVGTPDLYFSLVGGQPKIPIPPSVIVLFEMTMLGMLISTFLSVFLDSRFPAYQPMHYVPEISDGKIAILFECEAEMEGQVTTAMTEIGAETIEHAEARAL
jgi:hypothetical protein